MHTQAMDKRVNQVRGNIDQMLEEELTRTNAHMPFTCVHARPLCTHKDQRSLLGLEQRNDLNLELIATYLEKEELPKYVKKAEKTIRHSCDL